MYHKCNHCKYVWDYKGKAIFYCSCPKCLYRVRIQKKSMRVPVLADIGPITEVTSMEDFHV